MNDAPETSLIHVGNNQWMSANEARAKGLRPVAVAPAKPIRISLGDQVFGLALLAIIIVLGIIFTRGLHTVMWGY